MNEQRAVIYYMNIKFCRNYVTCYFLEFYFETKIGELFRSWDKGCRTLGHQLQTGKGQRHC